MTAEWPVHSLASTLDVVGPALSDDLVPRVAWDRARALAARLPAALAEWVYLECRLDERSNRTDLTIGVDRGSIDLLSGRDRSLDRLGALRAPAWDRLRAFARTWGRDATTWRDRVSRLWLEFDIDGEGLPVSAGPLAPPSVFFELENPGGGQGLDPGEWPLLAAPGEQLRAGIRRGPTPSDEIGRCLGLLPAGARLLYLGVFPPRSTGGVRLCMTGLDDRTLAGYAAEIGWPGRADLLERELNRLRRVHGRGAGVIDIDLGESVGPALGLEYFFRRDCQARGVLAESALLDLLVAAGLASAERRHALGTWVGSRYALLPHELWESVVHRRVNHVKLTWAGEEWREAKVYLAVGHPVRRRASTQ
jgi:hypothetical protein